MKLEDLFTKELLLWRYVSTLGCMFFLQFIPVSFCSIYHTIIAQGIFNPLIIVYNLLTYYSPAKLIHWAVLCICFVLFARVHIKCYTVSAWVPMNRLEKCKRLLSPAVLFRFFLLMTACVLLANFYTSLAHPDFIILMLCRPGNNMCNKHMSIIVFMSAYIGLCYGYKYFMQNGNLVTIAPAHPRKLQQIKARLNLKMMKEACSMYGASKFSFLIAICLYMACGIAMSLFNNTDWKEWLVILDLPLMILTATVTGLVAVTLALFSQVFNIFVTEPIQIPLAAEEDSNPEKEGDSWRLCHALSSAGLLQVLAFWDLKSLASSDPRNYLRRPQVFAISQPGGHPRNWLGIMNPSLNLIRKFTERLRKQNCPEDLPLPPLPKPVDPTSAPTDLNKNEVAKPPSPTIKEKLILMFMGLKKYPFFAYFLSDLPDAANRSIFAEALPVIWAVQSLGDLVAASFTEDKFGVVQRNIPDILMAFIHLQKVVDSLSRGTMTRRAGTGETLPAELQLRKALRSTLRSSLYTVTTTFGRTVLDLKVSSECQSKLQSYLDFKEG